MRVTTALVALDLPGLRPIRDRGLSLEDRKASGLPKDPKRKSMEPKLRFRDFAQGTRENVEIVADVFDTSRATKRTSSKPNMKHLHFQAVRRQSLSVSLAPRLHSLKAKRVRSLQC